MRKLILFLLVLKTNTEIFSQTFSATENTSIPDDGTSIEFTLEVSGLPTVIDTVFGLETVCVNIDHTWDSDLEIKIIAPDGTAATIIYGIGGDGDNFTNTCVTENALNTFGSGTAPFTGEFKPTGDMGIINNGQNPNGTWKLYIYDTYAFADEGYIYNWSITFGDEPAMPFVFTETNLPIVLINTGGQIINDEPKIEAEFYIIDNGVGMLNHPTDTNYAYEGKILTELQGFTGPYYPKKNYDFDLVNVDGIEIDTSLLGLPAENDFILKAEYLDYTLIKNSLSYEMSRRMGRYAPRTRFVELVLNDEYLGIYTITEKVKRDKNRVDIAKLDADDIAGDSLTGGYIFEMNINGDPPDWVSDYAPVDGPLEVEFQMVYPKSDSVQPEQLDYIHAYTDAFEDALAGGDFLDSVEGYRSYISVKSFIDFMLVNEFSSNYDSYGRSTYLFKDRNGQLNIGPPWDYDRAYAPWTVEGWVWEITHGYWPFPFWWSRFRLDEEWRYEVYCRWTDLRESTLSIDSFYAFIDSCSNFLQDAAVRNFEKWGELGVTDYTYQVDELKEFVSDRLDWIDEELSVDYFEAPTITIEHAYTADLVVSFEPSLTNANSFLWDFGDGNISIEPSPTHTYASAGMYHVTLEANYFYGCVATAETEVEPFVSISESPENSISVFPNPFIESLFIEMPSSEDWVVTLYDALGQPVIQNKFPASNRVFLPGNSISPGIYMLEVTAKGKKYRKNVTRI
ncbi:MAG: CotH kinase family protein [Chitinophagales bacterium]